MSQHDFEIANQGFPAFRADLNNSLQALASNSAGTTEPTTTYAYQMWYDETTDLLKMRNSDDDAWITLASFNQTTDEWEIRSAVIQAVDSAGVVIKTDEGTTRIEVQDDGDVSINSGQLFVDQSTGNVGIGESAPTRNLVIKDTDGQVDLGLVTSNTGVSALMFADTDDSNIGRIQYLHSTNDLTFTANDTEAFRIDSSQRVLIGHTSNLDGDNLLQLSSNEGATLLGRRYVASLGGPRLDFGKSRSGTIGSNTIVNNGDQLGAVTFRGDDGTDIQSTGVQILASVDGAPGANDMPGRLEFYTTADGSTSPTQRMRIDSSGKVGVNTSTMDGFFNINSGADNVALHLESTDNSCNITQADNAGSTNIVSNSGTLRFFTGGTAGTAGSGVSEGMRIDTSQRVLMGYTQSLGNNRQVQIINGASNAVASLITAVNGNGGAQLEFVKGRGGVAQNNATIVQDDDFVGLIRFFGADGTDLSSETARISAEIDGTPGSNDMPGRIVFETTSDGASTTTERMRITNDGSVGINTTSPSGALHVNTNSADLATGTPSINLTGSSGPNIRYELTGTGAQVWSMGMENNNSDFQLYNNTNAAVAWRVNSNVSNPLTDINLTNSDNNYVINVNPLDGVGNDGMYRLYWKTDASVFTGYHYYKKKDENEVFEMGDVVVLENGKATKCTTANATNVAGIISGHPMPGGRYLSNNLQEIATEENAVEVASLGDSQDWNRTLTHYLTGFKVCDENGSISAGDLLCSASRTGYLMKQDGVSITTQTVGKSMDDVTFDSDGTASGVYGYIYCG